MYTLYIDTHYDKIVIVIYQNTEIKIQKEIDSHNNHSVILMPLLIETIKEAQINLNELNQIIVINGPGSFTGVRIGVTIAKTLAFTLKIPIKVMSSLLIKALSFDHEKVWIGEREKNGIFIGKFDKENDLIEEYQYLKNKEITNNSLVFYEDIEINYEKIIKYAQKLKEINPHLVNPLYVKKIEVQK